MILCGTKVPTDIEYLRDNTGCSCQRVDKRAAPFLSGVRWWMKKGRRQATGWAGNRKGVRPQNTCHLSLKVLFHSKQQLK